MSDHNVQEDSSVPFSPPDACPVSLDSPLTVALGKNPSAFSILESKGPLCMTASETALIPCIPSRVHPGTVLAVLVLEKALLAEFGNYSLERDFPSTESAFTN